MARGASWNPELEERIGETIAREARSFGANWLAAVRVNLLRHPGWGRAQETCGEDPLHVGDLGAAAPPWRPAARPPCWCWVSTGAWRGSTSTPATSRRSWSRSHRRPGWDGAACGPCCSLSGSASPGGSPGSPASPRPARGAISPPGIASTSACRPIRGH
ncbi:MAG: hypothetical protein VKK62_05830 [Synechococcaceae cyanobacterium]|nr:hypothetical protein [Synechococcaceae cyanobacterium]